MNRKIPMYLLSGFLGSGKTTVLLEMLKYCKEKLKKPGLVLNEVGSVNVEKHLFQSERMIELLDGCICCSIKEDLIGSLSFYLKRENKVDVLFIEGTGISNPKDIVNAFNDHRLRDHFELESIISVVDASMYMEYRSIFASSKEIRELLNEQIRTSTVIVLNKVDLLNQQKKAKVMAKLHNQIKGNQRIMETVYGKIDCQSIFQNRNDTIDKNENSQKKNHLHHHHNHLHTFQMVKIEDVPFISQSALRRWLLALPSNIVRGKGIFYSTDDQRKYQFQLASRTVEFREIAEHLKYESCIILIGTTLEEDKIRNSFYQRFKQTHAF